MSDEHIVKSYDNDLNQITSLIMKMGEEVIKSIDIAYEAIKSSDGNLVQAVRDSDHKINLLDAEIDQYAITVIALRQPVAIDLRFLVTATKIATILERIGDLAKNIVKRITESNNKVNNELVADFDHMINLVKNMITNVLQAFSDQDEIQASIVRKKDEEVNEIYRNILYKIQNDMMNHSEKIPFSLRVLFVAKNLERIGDHTAKLAKHVLYIASGAYPAKIKNSK